MTAGPPGRGARGGHLGQLTCRVLFGPLAQFGIALGGGHVGHGAHLVQGHLAPTQGTDKVGELPSELTDVGERARRCHRDPEALGDPVLRRGRPLLAKGLGALDLAQVHDDLAFSGCLGGKELLEALGSLLVRQGGCRTDHVGADTGTERGDVGSSLGHQS